MAKGPWSLEGLFLGESPDSCLLRLAMDLQAHDTTRRAESHGLLAARSFLQLAPALSWLRRIFCEKRFPRA